MSLNRYIVVIFIFLIGLLGGCASSTPPVQDMKIAKMALLNATEAETDAEAKVYYERAQSYLLKARKKMQEKSYEEAKYLAQKATADARVAKIKASNSVLSQKVKALDIALKKLKHEFVTIEEEKEQ